MNHHLFLVLLPALSSFAAASAAATPPPPPPTPTALPPYKDASLPVPARVADLVARMTPDELVAAVTYRHDGTPAQLEREFGATGLGATKITVFLDGNTALSTLRARNALQQSLMKSSRLNIPVSISHEGLHSGSFFGTIFPMPSLTACSWNDSLPLAIGRVLGLEARAYGVDNAWSPVVNMWTDDRFGRYQEGFSPDPTITARMGAAIVLGMQGGASAQDDYLPGGFNSSAWATAKHFAGYGSALGGLNGGAYALNNRTLFQQYLRPWRAMAAVGLRGVMPSHNAVLDVPMHLNRFLIRDVLRGEFGFGNGMTVSDCNDIGAAFDFGASANLTQNAALAALAGLDADLQCGSDSAQWAYYNELRPALAQGLLRLADLQELAGHLLTQKFASGLFDAPLADESWLSRLDAPEHRQLAYEAAAQSIVLLANANGSALPLAFGAMTKGVAFVGAAMLAATGGRDNMLGPYTLDSGLVEVDLIPQAFAKAFPATPQTVTAGASPDNSNASGIAAAVAAARAADVVVAALGDSLKTCGEWGDRDSLDLPGAQLQLLEALLDTGVPVVLVLVNGRAASFGPANALLYRCAAVLEAWRPGEMGAKAIVDILSGAVNPSGKLTSQWAQHVGQLGSGAQPWLQRRVAKWVANARGPPDATDGRVYDPYIATDFPSTPLFRFGQQVLFYSRRLPSLSLIVRLREGHPLLTLRAPPTTKNHKPPRSGLSYTTFAYKTIAVDVVPASIAALPGRGTFSGRGGAGYREALAADVLRVTVHLCNSGARDGAEAVQVYSQDLVFFPTPIVRYWKRLVGYAKVFLAAGACGDAVVTVTADDLALYDDVMQLRVVPGTYVISAGGRSDQDILQANVTLS